MGVIVSLAIFDLDNTLLSTDSDHAWGEFLLEQGAVDPVAYREANDQHMAAYEAGTLDILAYLAIALKPLAENSPEQLAAWHQQFMASKIRSEERRVGKSVDPGGCRINKNKKRGDGAH